MATGATVRTLRGPHLTSSALIAVGGSLLAVALLVAGFEASERYIVCPAQGTFGGGGSGFVTGPYHYDCVDGKLTFRSGACMRSGC
jgi:cell division protein FtsX